MYVFTRTRYAKPKHLNDARGFAIEVAARASKLSGLDVGAWCTTMSAQMGTFLWGVVAPDLKTLHSSLDKMYSDKAYGTFIANGMDWFDVHSEDTVAQIVHGTIDPTRRPMFIASVGAVCANGHITSGIAAGVEIAQRAEKTSGMPTLFVRNVTGLYGGVAWISGYTSMAELEMAEDKTAADHDFAEFVDREASVYLPGASQRIIQRISP